MIKKIAKFFAVGGLLLSTQAFAAPEEHFIFEVNILSSGETFKIDTIPPTGGGFSFNLDCGDGDPELVDISGSTTCTYDSVGLKTIKISDKVGDGTGFPQLEICATTATNQIKSINVVQWGTGKWPNLRKLFQDCANLGVSATDAPDFSAATNMSRMFRDAPNANPDTSQWDVSTITDMFALFMNASSANPDVSNWEVGNVQFMHNMFNNATIANPKMSSWDIGNVTAMADMLNGAALSTTNYDAALINFANQAITPNVNFHAGSANYCFGKDAKQSLLDGGDGAGGAVGWASITDGIEDCSIQPENFVITVQTDNGDPGGTTFIIPTEGSGYNYNVDCDAVNPGTNLSPIGQTGDYTCTYAAVGSYQIRIQENEGDNTGFPQIHFNNTGDKLKITSLDQWGTGKWTIMDFAFRGASNMLTPATDVPDFSEVTSMIGMFYYATNANPDTSGWDTSKVTNMRSMFSHATNATPDTSGWDTSKVTSMDSMFINATSANPITTTSGNIWNTSAVESMSEMFWGATSANPDTSGWDTSKVTSMAFMFISATSANPDTLGWDTSKVRNMRSMFSSATSADPDTSGWDTSKVTDMGFMFNSATNASPITTTSGNVWDTSQVTRMDSMFNRATSANPDTSGWDTSKVTDMSEMFWGATNASPTTTTSGNIWNTSQVTDMEGMFSGTIADHDISGWDTSKVTDMRNMFNAFTGTSLNTSGWDTSKVTDMYGMFRGATNVNPDTSGWDTGKVRKMGFMFSGATNANPDMSGWHVELIEDMKGMFQNSALSKMNYDAMLINFADQSLQPDVEFHGGIAQYCAGSAARATLLATPNNWTITDDGGKDCTPGDCTGNSIIDINDTTCAIGLAKDAGLADYFGGDVDIDGDVDKDDVSDIIEIILDN